MECSIWYQSNKLDTTILQVPYVKEGLEAIIFTADGDMRQALNNLQATYFGFGLVDSAAVFKVCLLPWTSAPGGFTTPAKGTARQFRLQPIP